MTKEELIKVLTETTEVKELTKGHSYIIQVEIGDMPKEHTIEYLTRLSNKLQDLGLSDFLITPTSNGQGCLKFYEIKDRKLFEVE